MTAVFLGNYLADPVFDRLEDPFSFLDSSGRRRADLKLDLASVDRGEKIAAEKPKHRNDKRQHERRNDRHDEAAREQRGQDLHIALAQSFEATLEMAVQTRKPVGRYRDDWSVTV